MVGGAARLLRMISGNQIQSGSRKIKGQPVDRVRVSSSSSNSGTSSSSNSSSRSSSSSSSNMIRVTRSQRLIPS